MGNCFVLYKPRKVLQVVKADGKILEYKAAVLVEDMLMNFPGHGIALSREASQHLPSNYQLKIGHVYHLLPRLSDQVGISSPSAGMDNCKNGTKRIKVIITKQQLHELLLKKISVEEILSGFRKDGWDGGNSLQKRWKPLLEIIPEVSE